LLSIVLEWICMTVLSHRQPIQGFKRTSIFAQSGMNSSMAATRQDLALFDEYALDRARWQLSWRGDPVALNRKTFDLLLYLMDRRERVVGKEELLQALWPEQFIEESNLSQHIFLLRKALSRHSSGEKMVETVPGRGYRFIASVVESEPAPSHLTLAARESITRITIEEEQEDAAPADAGRSRSVSGGRSRRGLWLAVSALMVVVLLAAGWLHWQHWLDHAGGAPVQIVLLPMEGTTGDTILDRSLTQVLRMDLSQSPYVSVVPTSIVAATLTQMMHKPDDAMTQAMAREVCERTDSQGVLSGSIAKDGQHFLITEEASNCVNGAVMAAAKDEASKPEDLPHAFDTLASTLRQKLGESRRSVARFDTPLVAMNTASLKALEVYTQANALTLQGKWADAIALEKEAIALDPEFAAARYDLAASYISLGDFVNGRVALVKAYEVRNSASASEPVRLAITTLYEIYSTEDLYAAERNYRNWIQLYPHAVQAWNGISVVQRDLGDHAESAASALRALAMRPNNQGLYLNAAYEQIRSGNVQGARSTLQSAVAHNLDGDRIHADYSNIAILLHDSTLLQAQRQWVEAHPQAVYCRIEELEEDIGSGQFVEAHRLLTELTQLLRQLGLPELADAITKEEGINLAEAGDTDAGFHIFKSVPLDPENGNDLEGLAESGDFKTAIADLEMMRAKYPAGTLWTLYWSPLIQARFAMARHKPLQAVAFLEAARPLQRRSLDIPLVRGDAYLAAGQPALAEKEYRTAIADRDVSAELGDYPLSWLGLGRTLAAEGNRTAATDAYRHFFALWVHADPEAMYLQQAKVEFAKLQVGATRPNL
jgi:DNA-binding winged helix-turn-helix (wHTH) protein/Flp pilus assembly protein TadD